MKNWLKILIMTLTAGLLVACGNSNDDPGKVAEAFYKEIIEGDPSKAMDYLHIPPEMLQQGMEEEYLKGKMTTMFGMIQEKVKEEGGIDSIKAGKVEYNADKTHALVDLTLKPKKGEATTEKVPLIKTDKGWKLDMNR